MLLSWFFAKYRDHLPPSSIIRYEDMVASGGKVFSAVTPTADRLAEPLESRNANPSYDWKRLRKAGKTAVFLPQVAGDRGWFTGKLLEQLALKAGLPADGWRGAALAVFEAEIFGEPRSPAQGPSGSRYSGRGLSGG